MIIEMIALGAVIVGMLPDKKKALSSVDDRHRRTDSTTRLDLPPKVRRRFIRRARD